VAHRRHLHPARAEERRGREDDRRRDAGRGLLKRRALAVVVGAAGCGRIGFDPLGGDGAGANVVFVTSTKQLPTMSDLGGFDAVCAQRAAAAGLTGTYIAWLSQSQSARARLGGARGFVRRDGLAIADAVDQLAGAMWRPVALDENGDVVPAGDQVMTGADHNGDELGNCNGLSDPTGGIATGFPDGTASIFGSVVMATPASCGIPYRNYCFEIDRVVAISEPVHAGRRAFTSSMQPGGGIARADANCAADASAAGLVGSFKALLAVEGASAASRFTSAGANWVRLDGVAIAATPADFLSGAWQAPIAFAADGTRTDVSAWFGADDPSTPGTAASTCTSWTIADASVPFLGDETAAGPHAFHDVNDDTPCNGPGFRVYCAEE
jgi:hypothetical protein